MNYSEYLSKKIHTIESLKKQINAWRLLDKKIVFTNGCFDLLHRGHIDYLSKAAGFGDIIIIGLNSDASVKKLKGENRPINDEQSRAMILAALCFIDAVIIFNEDTPLSLIKLIKPDILVKGGDYSLKNIVGSDFVIDNGGEVKIIDFLPGYSTTIIEAKIKGLT